ncbi:L-lactate transporter [subsurface metagenome]
MKHLHYGWVIVITITGALGTHSLSLYTFGIFLGPLTTEFNWERGALSGALSLALLVAGLLAIPAGMLTDKYGPRVLVTASGLLLGTGFLLMSQVNALWQVYLIWGLVIGTSIGCLVIPTLSTIPKWFTRRRGIALGLASSGFGLGGIISPPLAQWLISSYGWQQAYIILGLITIPILTLLAQSLKHSPQRIGLRPYGEDGTIADKQPTTLTAGGFSLNQAIKTSPFWLFGLIMPGFSFCVLIIITHIVPHAVDTGISAMLAASILSIVAATSIIGRNLIGFICDRAGARPSLTACLAILTLSLIWLLFAKEVWMFYIFAAVFGIAYGGMIPVQTLVTAELFGLSSLGIILGSTELFFTLGGALGPPVAGSIFDVTGSYRLALLICIIVSALAITLSLILLKAKGWRDND